MAFRLPYIKPFVRHADCSLMILGYRGYGESEGSPSERGIQLDAQVGPGGGQQIQVGMCCCPYRLKNCHGQ